MFVLFALTSCTFVRFSDGFILQCSPLQRAHKAPPSSLLLRPSLSRATRESGRPSRKKVRYCLPLEDKISCINGVIEATQEVGRVFPPLSSAKVASERGVFLRSRKQKLAVINVNLSAEFDLAWHQSPWRQRIPSIQLSIMGAKSESHRRDSLLRIKVGAYLMFAQVHQRVRFESANESVDDKLERC